MASVEIEIASKKYSINCQDGHELRIAELASRVNSTIIKPKEMIFAKSKSSNEALFLYIILCMYEDLNELQSLYQRDQTKLKTIANDVEAIEQLLKKL